ncbi:MAG: nuclear transport factor 2 family protein [Planctomycetaceae bacterium]|nr:nuclear transport factor 2 family protein [Planctomycetaceae bacterium]
MRFFAAALLLVLGACSKEGPIPLADAQSREMIREAIKNFHEAGDKGDMGAIKGLLDPDVTLVISHEEVVTGFEAVLKKLNERLKAFDGPRNTITGKESIRIQGDTALVTYIANVGTQRGIITSVYRKTKDNKWLILHLHDTWSMPAKK